MELDQSRKDEEKKAQDRLDLIRAYKTSFNSESGKLVLFDMMSQTGFLKTNYGDAFQEGRRSVILDIITILNKSEEEILTFLNNRLGNYEEGDII